MRFKANDQFLAKTRFTGVIKSTKLLSKKYIFGLKIAAVFRKKGFEMGFFVRLIF